MSAGTLVPFLSEVALPGDTWDFDLECDVKTLPTVGPLFGSFKVELHLFSIPIRLYNKYLHSNTLNIGYKMNLISLPSVRLKAITPDGLRYTDTSQIHSSCLLRYLGISGIGRRVNGNVGDIYDRVFNATPLVAYFDIYKNYYANKQEEIGAMLHTDLPSNATIGAIEFINIYNQIPLEETMNLTVLSGTGNYNGRMKIVSTGKLEPAEILLKLVDTSNGARYIKSLEEIFGNYTIVDIGGGEFELNIWNMVENVETEGYFIQESSDVPKIKTFQLEDIDNIREGILNGVSDVTNLIPIKFITENNGNHVCTQFNQEGLLLKCYNSDLFNNWLKTEIIDGNNGINEITAVDTSSGELQIQALILARKVYDMLNRISVTGGSYDDWLDAVYSHERVRSVENPIFHGGLIKELAFQEVVNTSASEFDNERQPLGQLAGRGMLTQKHKGGKVIINVNEPSYIMGIVSLTPRLDYSQGNKWDVNLRTMDDLFKPALGQIGFQELITDQMAWWDTEVDDQGVWTYKSAGKQPAWINYQTAVNRCFGDFAEVNKQMFMTLNRRYEMGLNGIKDLTTYIDPVKFNQIFADARIDAQNFWVQIGMGIEKRSKMSSKIMPNL